MTELPDIFIGKNRFSLPEMMPVHQYGAGISTINFAMAINFVRTIDFTSTQYFNRNDF
ncbi:hypothetical protein [Vibrio spartinae]|uniref:hypothetical protein n=1 Tax=Vibrio spartinae TaxID=1918945 RepID=UPI0013565A01|nr:hypothetical protein [Vibrio spartinae]